MEPFPDPVHSAYEGTPVSPYSRRLSTYSRAVVIAGRTSLKSKGLCRSVQEDAAQLASLLGRWVASSRQYVSWPMLAVLLCLLSYRLSHGLAVLSDPPVCDVGSFSYDADSFIVRNRFKLLMIFAEDVPTAT
jgi:hypothetical protein